MSDVLRLDAFLPFRLSFTSNLVSDTIAGIYVALFDLRIPEWRLIAVVAEEEASPLGGATQQEIGRRTRMDKVTVSRAAIAMVERGLMARVAHPDDKRSHLLHLTDAGRDLYAQVAPKALELERRIFARFDAAELAAFTATLRKIDAAILAEEQAG
ncbi:MarR family transcriptional regulator [Sphingomonas sp. KR1UV-12]|uniref:MarR family transcriptional regulator n=1 Tax=Sphingomonas aurea TaxID=3063994 RepID=A0ABT9EJJ7_9SPHN|nr:MarR family transcriptional regulator [Sphingomonas sp. KR1UV-12]MDP1027111.1 MarR family transcriptional regulator [Sphingomonas sp. KR1UV-12]